MSLTPPTAGYLDVIFASIRSFAHELSEARGWIGRAREVRGSSWGHEMLTAARGSLARAEASLAEVEEHVRDLGDPDEIPAPLDQLAKNLAGMRADLEKEKGELATLERAMMGRPIGQG